jgi:hypothetical protein
MSKIWATVVHDRSSLPGVLVLDYTLRKTTRYSSYPFVALLTPEAARDGTLCRVLTAAGIGVAYLERVHATRLGQPREGNWERLSVWNLTNYEVH